MEKDDPRRELDDFTGALCEKLRHMVEFVAQSLLSLDNEIALVQIDILQKRTIDRLKGGFFDLWALALMPEARGERLAAMFAGTEQRVLTQ